MSRKPHPVARHVRNCKLPTGNWELTPEGRDAALTSRPELVRFA